MRVMATTAKHEKNCPLSVKGSTTETCTCGKSEYVKETI